ncbi:glutamine--fructose-6-phosphate transaminase (isomerizing) [Prevotella sp. PCHR]|uniref:Glutamine--fructose-6-phosphate aminotransferase [isomerizing] n=1 Tax=Xylanibacter caecicola TaxID=2736294 RepID=A0ABX2B003_9BACT|nr:glutamine--fructose-6-phosphate transaminase (isomerizing) [Xylanibacter caecicola]NPE24613.1 glutamine--fructose-6-phosphate transaminase (isomerizing) [Xylanibacter caecicola]
MCGIVGYIGMRNACPILLEGLHKLEYRGYDSAGVALITNTGNLRIYKAKGKVADLESVAADKDCSGNIGIAHTRWATHGVPSEANSHPHVSQSGDITLVHNGIIENYATLKEQLIEKGYTFKSETDTEVLVQLIQYTKDSVQACNLAMAVRLALKKVIGAYAIVVIDRQEPEKLVCARKSSPLAIGVTEENKELFIASDASPIAAYTKQIIYLNDDEIAVCERDKDIQVFNLDNKRISPEVKEVDIDLNMLSKDNFDHFMLKEIFDQPNVLRDCMRGRIINAPYSRPWSPQQKGKNTDSLSVILSAVTLHRRELLRARRIIILSCGTSWHAGLIGKQLIEHFCKLPVEVAYASEFRYSDSVIEPDDVVMAISQSGETADTMAAMEMAKKRNALVFGIVNAVGSGISRISDTGVYIHVGPEIGVASTKAFTGQVTVLVMLALALGMAKGTVSQEEYNTVLHELVMIPDKIQKVLEQNDKIKDIAKKYIHSKNFLYLGRGYNYPVALEGALKLKEISYIHAEGYPAAEMKHGPIALIDSEMPVVFLATHHQLYQKIVSNMQEVISRNGKILAIVTEGDEQVKAMVDETIEVPPTIACLAPLLSVIPLQLLSYHVAVAKGLNVDQPRNLAKSVTVE